MAEDIEAAFHEEMLSVYKRAKDECHYSANRFLQLVNEQGGLQAAKTLLHSQDYSEGFTELYLRGRLDITMEAIVLQQPWSQLFAEEELAIAQKRLRELNFSGA